MREELHFSKVSQIVEVKGWYSKSSSLVQNCDLIHHMLLSPFKGLSHVEHDSETEKYKEMTKKVYLERGENFIYKK
jgi:hypothetical protein